MAICLFRPAERLLVRFEAQKLMITLFLWISNVLQRAKVVANGQPLSDHTRKRIKVNPMHFPLHSSQLSQLHKVHH